MMKQRCICLFLLCIICCSYSAIGVTPTALHLLETKTLASETGEEITDSLLEELLDILTIADIISLLEQHVCNTDHYHPYYAARLRSSLTQGTEELGMLGITPATTLRTIQSLLGSIQSEIQNTHYRYYLLSILPLHTTIRTALPTHIVNLTQIETALGNVTVRLEIFSKVFPILDRVVVRQGGVIRQRLTQSSLLWPVIGGRITVAGIPIGVIGFGPRIKWTTR